MYFSVPKESQMESTNINSVLTVRATKLNVDTRGEQKKTAA